MCRLLFLGERGRKKTPSQNLMFTRHYNKVNGTIGRSVFRSTSATQKRLPPLFSGVPIFADGIITNLLERQKTGFLPKKARNRSEVVLRLNRIGGVPIGAYSDGATSYFAQPLDSTYNEIIYKPGVGPREYFVGRLGSRRRNVGEHLSQRGRISISKTVTRWHFCPERATYISPGQGVLAAALGTFSSRKSRPERARRTTAVRHFPCPFRAAKLLGHPSPRALPWAKMQCPCRAEDASNP